MENPFKTDHLGVPLRFGNSGTFGRLADVAATWRTCLVAINVGSDPFGLLRFLRCCLDTRSWARRPLPTSSGRHAWGLSCENKSGSFQTKKASTPTAATAAAGAKATAVTAVAVAAAALAVTVPVAAPAPNPNDKPMPNSMVALLLWKHTECTYQ